MDDEETTSVATRKCPWCAEEILAEAKKCKHCGEFLTDEVPTSPAQIAVGQDTEDVQTRVPDVESVTSTEDTEMTTAHAPVWQYETKWPGAWKCVEHGKRICTPCGKRAKMPSRPGGKGGRPTVVYASNERDASALLCPHCQVRGQVTTEQIKVKHGISGGKATAAVMTAGLSVVAGGLSRKDTVTQMHCGHCGMTWQVQ
jgi:hypothetical protein